MWPILWSGIFLTSGYIIVMSLHKGKSEYEIEKYKFTTGTTECCPTERLLCISSTRKKT